MLDYRQVRKFVAKPALMRLDAWSQAAENLCMGTAMTESGLVYIDQKDKADKPGPAYGLCQMEAPTHLDLYDTILLRNKELRRKVLGMVTPFTATIPDPGEMVFNMLYAFAMCRVFYMRVPIALPLEGDAMSLAQYHKKYYNTYLGATKVEDSVKHFDYVIKRSKEAI